VLAVFSNTSDQSIFDGNDQWCRYIGMRWNGNGGLALVIGYDRLYVWTKTTEGAKLITLFDPSEY
jgi:hypothetical protein